MKTLMVFSLVMAFIRAASAQSPDSLLYEAASENAKSNYLTAIRLYDRLIAIDGDSAKYYFYRGQDYSMIRDEKNALSDYSKALELNPNFFDAFMSRAILYFSRNEPEKSVNDYNMALRIADSTETSIRAFIYNNRGNAKALRNDLPGAYSDYLAAYQLDSESTRALKNLGDVLNRLDRVEEATSYLTRLVVLAPEDLGGRNQLGYAFFLQKDYRQAIQQFDEVIKIDSNQTTTLNARCLARYNLQDYAGALEDVNKAIDQHPEFSYSYRSRALAEFAFGAQKEGCADLMQAVQLGYIEKYGQEVRVLFAQHCGDPKF